MAQIIRIKWDNVILELCGIIWDNAENNPVGQSIGACP